MMPELPSFGQRWTVLRKAARPLTRGKCGDLSRTLRPECVARVPPIYPVEHVGELRRRDRQSAVGRRRPQESAALQPLRIERHTDPVMPNDFNQLASGTSEN